MTNDMERCFQKMLILTILFANVHVVCGSSCPFDLPMECKKVEMLLYPCSLNHLEIIYFFVIKWKSYFDALAS